MSNRIAAFLIAVASGCFNPQFQNGVPCSADRQCPGDQVCHIDDRCYDPDQIPDLDTTLSQLTISEGTLVPAFDPAVTEYTVELGLRVDAFTVTPTAAFPEISSIDVAGNPTDSGAASVPLDLRLGDNPIDITVTSDTGDAVTYSIAVNRGAALAQQAYTKASNAEAGDAFGGADADGISTGDVALSGNTIAVTASGEDSDARVINGNQEDETSPNSGAVYIFVRDDTGWSQQAYVKPSELADFDRFGTSLAPNTFGLGGTGSAIALDGDTLAVGTHDHGVSVGTGTGRVYVFVRSGNIWMEQTLIEASNAEEDDRFGASIALSGDTLAVGAPGEDSSATGINGNEADNTLESAGAVYTFVRNGSDWQQEAYIKASNTGAGDGFGASLDLDGDTLVVGASAEDSSTSTVNGNQANDAASDAGAAYVFERSGGWVQQAYLKATNTGANDFFGSSVSVSTNTIVVGAPSEDSASASDESNNDASDSGAVYVFTRTGSSWFARAYLKASNIGADDFFGGSVAVAGRAIAIGAFREDSSGRGVGAMQNGDASDSGAVYLFEGADDSWTPLLLAPV